MVKGQKSNFKNLKRRSSGTLTISSGPKVNTYFFTRNLLELGRFKFLKFDFCPWTMKKSKYFVFKIKYLNLEIKK